MKKAFTFLAIISAFALLPINSASAHDSCREGRLIGYTPCGKPILAYHEVVGYDRCGRHVWEWVTHYPSSCHCREQHRDYDGCRPAHVQQGYSYARPGSWNFHLRF